MLALFEVNTFGQLADMLKGPDVEGFDAYNVSLFHHRLAARRFERPELSAQQLLEYDQLIVRHWLAITEKRNLIGHRLYPKYFQYLSLLFTEIYLDRYFRDPARLLADLNAHVREVNADKPAASQVEAYEAGDLNKLAFWYAPHARKRPAIPTLSSFAWSGARTEPRHLTHAQRGAVASAPRGV
jgi:hypothetical protein